MQFLQFLKENYKPNVAHVMLQKIVDMIDHGYVEYSPTKMVINLGKLVKDSSFYDLNIIIRKAKETSVKLGKNRIDDKLAIVVDTNYYPQRQNLHKLFTREEVVSGFGKEFTKYIKEFHDGEKQESKTGHETSKEVNTNKGFETSFKNLISKIKDAESEYNAAKKDLESKHGSSALPSHKATYGAAIEHLKKDTFGTSAKEFVSKMLKLADPKYMEHIDSEYKKKLINRLTNYYEHNFAD
jgi:hypothetical protein